MKPACCLNCHFTAEEQYALPRLPPAVARRLEREHAEIRDALAVGSIPADALLAHAAWEDAVFPSYLPAALAQHFAADHELVDGHLRFFGFGGPSSSTGPLRGGAFGDRRGSGVCAACGRPLR